MQQTAANTLLLSTCKNWLLILFTITIQTAKLKLWNWHRNSGWVRKTFQRETSKKKIRDLLLCHCHEHSLIGVWVALTALSVKRTMIICMYVGVTAGWQGELGERPSAGKPMFKPLIHQANALLKKSWSMTLNHYQLFFSWAWLLTYLQGAQEGFIN